ncbi:hypothetical protein MIND_01146300 [Mycena indigotica]|uniref:Uncharacterized protein n=1 Tax=Mycena indigotica TaxID=2126181 RepID=A0A8H6S7D6_9AGAR|nr:uncharacterized protein MIND_01146300 [Mycena indigotica]KAF7293663.1 hypothetical protein MIND_01146300 [Mycena indigotica]
MKHHEATLYRQVLQHVAQQSEKNLHDAQERLVQRSSEFEDTTLTSSENPQIEELKTLALHKDKDACALELRATLAKLHEANLSCELLQKSIQEATIKLATATENITMARGLVRSQGMSALLWERCETCKEMIKSGCE